MKHLKKYEYNQYIDDAPNAGDYVLLKVDVKFHNKAEEITKFINNTIGQIYSVQLRDDEEIDGTVSVMYKNIPKDILTYFYKQNKVYWRNFSMRRIVEFSPTIDELTIKLNQNKYNL